MKYGLKKKEIELIIGIFKRNPEIEKVFIYGSRAKENYKKTSDIDLAIRLRKNCKEIARIKSELEDLPIIYEINLINEKEIPSGNFKKEYEETKRIFYIVNIPSPDI